MIAPADGFEERRLSYGELEARSNQLAHHLRGLGVGPETVVGLCLERTPSLLIGLLGILKAGGAYLPLDPSYPAERLSFMLADAGATVLLSEAALLARLPDGFGATAFRQRPLRTGSLAQPGLAPDRRDPVRSWSGSTPTGRGSRAIPSLRPRSRSSRSTRPM